MAVCPLLISNFFPDYISNRELGILCVNYHMFHVQDLLEVRSLDKRGEISRFKIIVLYTTIQAVYVNDKVYWIYPPT